MRLTDLVTPLKPLEAMAMGKMVLASDVGGHKELIQDNRTGYLFTAGDQLDLVIKMIQIASKATAFQNIGKQARETIVRERNWKVIVSRYETFYRQFL
jgi:glycosyltransferase involved in cell wall biosynthesis